MTAGPQTLLTESLLFTLWFVNELIQFNAMCCKGTH